MPWRATTAGAWLAPFLEHARGLSDVSEAVLSEALDALLPWDMRRRLDAEAPTHFETPAGSRIAIDYEAESGPAIHVRVQELYGLKSHPELAGGRVKPVFHLLSPAHRPIQTTGDLARFWAGAWSDVKKDMKGRYPRHVWPDDPANAAPTTHSPITSATRIHCDTSPLYQVNAYHKATIITALEIPN